MIAPKIIEEQQHVVQPQEDETQRAPQEEPDSCARIGAKPQQHAGDGRQRGEQREDQISRDP